MSLSKSPKETYELVTISCLDKKLGFCDVQRVCNVDRVECIYNAFKKNYDDKQEIQLPGVFIVCVIDDIHYLIDGGHRFAALKILYNKTKHDQRICINKIELNSKDEMLKLFFIVNNTLTVSEIPDGIHRTDINEVLTYFYKKAPKMIKSVRGKTKRPHINYVLFEEKIGIMLETHSVSEIITQLININNDLKSANIKRFKIKTSDKEDKLEHLREQATGQGGLYFGMFPDLECFDLLCVKKLPFVAFRKPLGAVLKKQICNRFFGKNDNCNCPFCDCEINRISCHFAHDIAHSKGGQDTIDNIFPSCGTCNLSMGTKNYDEFSTYLEECRSKCFF